LLPFMVVPLLLVARSLSWPARLGRIALAGAIAVAVVAPWSLSNVPRFRDPVLVSTNDGATLWGANCPATYDTGIVGGWSLSCVTGATGSGRGVVVLDPRTPATRQGAALARDAGCIGPAAAGMDPSERSTCFRRLAVRYARSRTGRLPAVVVIRNARTWGFYRPAQMVYANQGEGRPKWASWAGFGFLWVTLAFTVVGAVRLRRAGITLIPLLACVATVIAVSTLFYGLARFRLPFDVAACVLVAAAVIRPRAWTRPAGSARVDAGGEDDGPDDSRDLQPTVS
jgi:4-amino-4-deoxy-L-arabinose transferase-like glycosyltransferase